MTTLSHWGWGLAGEEIDAGLAAGLAQHFGFGDPQPPHAAPFTLRAPRIAPPPDIPASVGDHDRAAHAWGRSYCDVVRGFHGAFDDAPDFVARPRDEREIERLLEWCSSRRVAAIPYGGGTSVVGGVQPAVPAAYDGACSVDLRALDRVLEVDPVSQAARIQAGAAGPVLEKQLADHGLTLRFYPQSFERSTLGGWIATRAAGHYATGPTHIEDLVESVRAITPAGAWASRRLPGSGAGISPDRMLAGSEGILGVITEAWMRVRERPRVRAGATVAFQSFDAAVDAVRAILQSDCRPANCRLLEAEEARLTFSGDGSAALLVLGFESAGRPVEAELEHALSLCGGGDATRRAAGNDERGDDAASHWRAAFLRAPYIRDTLVAMGVLSETFETAITWERFPALREAVLSAARTTLDDAAAHVTCRFTHVYPDGPAAYFTVIAPARQGEEVEQWRRVKAAVSDAIDAHGATITHHHAVGRDHRPWYDRQRPEPFAAALRAAKAAVDPAQILNPGVLV